MRPRGMAAAGPSASHLDPRPTKDNARKPRTAWPGRCPCQGPRCDPAPQHLTGPPAHLAHQLSLGTDKRTAIGEFVLRWPEGGLGRERPGQAWPGRGPGHSWPGHHTSGPRGTRDHHTPRPPTTRTPGHPRAPRAITPDLPGLVNSPIIQP